MDFDRLLRHAMLKALASARVTSSVNSMLLRAYNSTHMHIRHPVNDFMNKALNKIWRAAYETLKPRTRATVFQIIQASRTCWAACIILSGDHSIRATFRRKNSYASLPAAVISPIVSLVFSRYALYFSSDIIADWVSFWSRSP